MLLPWLAYPLLLVGLCAGLGLGVDALSGRRLPGALILPAGFAALVVIAQAMGFVAATVTYAASVAIVLAGVGVVAAMPWRFGRPSPWAAAAALAAFVLFSAPVVLSGDPTFAVYGKASDIASWLIGATSDRPAGAALPFAAIQRVLGGEDAWRLAPYIAVLGALLALCAWQLARSLSSPGRALLAFLAVVPALIFGYAGWVGVGEMCAVVLIALLAALALGFRDGVTRWRSERTPTRYTAWIAPAIAALALLAVLFPWQPSLPIDAEAWLGGAALLLATAAVLFLGARIASAGSSAPLIAFGAALAVCAVVASAGVSLAPYQRLLALRDIAAADSFRDPVLVLGRDPYVGYFLRGVHPVLIDSARGKAIARSAGGQKGAPFETDQLDYKALLSYPTLIVPNSPAQSRPSLPYRLSRSSPYYDVWRLPAKPTFRLLFHMPVGGGGNAAGPPDCSQTVGLGLLALAGQLGAVPQTITLIAASPRIARGPGATVAVAPSQARRLCGRRWDWIEAIAPAG